MNYKLILFAHRNCEGCENTVEKFVRLNYKIEIWLLPPLFPLMIKDNYKKILLSKEDFILKTPQLILENTKTNDMYKIEDIDMFLAHFLKLEKELKKNKI